MNMNSQYIVEVTEDELNVLNTYPHAKRELLPGTNNKIILPSLSIFSWYMAWLFDRVPTDENFVEFCQENKIEVV